MGTIALNDINVSFKTSAGEHGGRIQVLRHVSLTVEDGEFCCIVGPSGCGKSTSLRIIHGLLKPDDGVVMIDGEEVMGPSLGRAFVFQHFNLLPWRTVRANVEFGLENMGLSKAERKERARRWLGMVGLGEFEDYYPAQLSGGMQQRVGLARALAVEPDTILMDEPFGAVDAQTRMLLQEALLQFWEENRRTILFVTHDIEEALFLADSVVIMGPRPGRVMRRVAVPFPRPRTAHLRGDPEFARLKDQIWTDLKSAIRSGSDANEASWNAAE